MPSTILLPREHLSWSQIDLWQRNRNDYMARYFRDEEGVSTPAMDFGKQFAEIMEGTSETSDPKVLAMAQVAPRYEIAEYKLEAVLKSEEGEIPLLGYLDTSHEDPTRGFREYKTGKTQWTQRKVDEHGQLTLYDLMIFLRFGGRPQSIYLDWFETVVEEEQVTMTGRHLHFETRRTMRQLIDMAALVTRTAREISDAYKHYLSTIL